MLDLMHRYPHTWTTNIYIWHTKHITKNIAITGLKGSGKGTIAQHLVNNHNYTELSFAYALKDVLAAVFNWPRHLLEGDTVESRQFRDTVDEWWGQELQINDFTPRYAMQNIGTELFRDRFCFDIWALVVKRKIETNKTVISDLRFNNEHRVVKDNIDLVVKVLPAKLPVWYNIAKQALEGNKDAYRDMHKSFPEVHKSEWETTVIPADIEICNDSTIDNLIQKFETAIVQYSTLRK